MANKHFLRKMKDKIVFLTSVISLWLAIWWSLTLEHNFFHFLEENVKSDHLIVLNERKKRGSSKKCPSGRSASSFIWTDRSLLIHLPSSISSLINEWWHMFLFFIIEPPFIREETRIWKMNRFLCSLISSLLSPSTNGLSFIFDRCHLLEKEEDRSEPGILSLACELGRALVVVGWPSVDGGTIVPSQHLTTARSISSHYKPRKAFSIMKRKISIKWTIFF